MTSDAGRIEWFKTIILPHEGALHARLRRIVRQPEEAEDVAAETLTRAYATESYARITAGRAYLFQIARNLLIDTARREKIVSFDIMADLDLLRVDDSVEAGLQARDELRWLGRVIETLPLQCRRAFVMRRVQDMSVSDIADEMGLSVSTVEKHLTKAVTMVMRAVKEREGNERGSTGRGETDAAGDRRGGRAPRR